MVATLAGALALSALAAGPAAAAECGNEAIRGAQHATFLPDCRGYELVSSPADVPYVSLTGGFGHVGAVSGASASSATTGAYAGAIAWSSYYPPQGDERGAFYLVSRRDPQSGTWMTESVVPGRSAGDTRYPECEPYTFLSPTLEQGVVSAGRESDAAQWPEQEYCPSVEPSPLVSGEPEGAQNLYLRDTALGTYQLVNLTPAGVTPSIATFQGGSTEPGHEYSRVVFSSEAPLTPEAPAGEAVYDWHEGRLSLVSVLPGGEPVAATVANSTGHTPEVAGVAPPDVGGQPGGAEVLTHSVSAAGSRVFLEAEGNLYLRINAEESQSALGSSPGAVNGEQCAEAAKACTIQLDAPQAGAAGPGGGGKFLWANAAGTKAFFTDSSTKGLTADTASGSGVNLYEYELPAGASVGTLTDLTAQPEADVMGLSGVSEDGSAVYFVARAVLSGPNAEGVSPKTRSANLYLLREGAADPTFIATLSTSDDRTDWAGSSAAYGQLTAHVSSNGEFIAFNSLEKLTGYDNAPEEPSQCTVRGREAPCSEIYLYSAATQKLACASCAPDGARPTGPTALLGAEDTAFTPSVPLYLQRNVLDGGQVFFNTTNALLPTQDTNGQSDVYEYDAGALHLISSGTSSRGSYFYEASPNGENVFFVTDQALVRRDTGNGISLYDARVGGGSPEPLAEPQPCEAEACHGAPPSGQPFSAPASIGFAGAGNLAPAPPVKSPKPTHKKAKERARKHKLRKALKACKRRKNARRRARCKRRARKRYGAKAARRGHSARHQRRHRTGRGRKHRRHGHRGAK